MVGLTHSWPGSCETRRSKTSGRGLIDRMKHYFLIYKLAPEVAGDVNIKDAYGHKHA